MYRVHSRNPEKTRKKNYRDHKESVVNRTASTLKIVRAPIAVQQLRRPPNSNISKLSENTITVMMTLAVQYHAFSLFLVPPAFHISSLLFPRSSKLVLSTPHNLFLCMTVNQLHLLFRSPHTRLTNTAPRKRTHQAMRSISLVNTNTTA